MQQLIKKLGTDPFDQCPLVLNFQWTYSPFQFFYINESSTKIMLRIMIFCGITGIHTTRRLRNALIR